MGLKPVDQINIRKNYNNFKNIIEQADQTKHDRDERPYCVDVFVVAPPQAIAFELQSEPSFNRIDFTMNVKGLDVSEGHIEKTRSHDDTKDMLAFSQLIDKDSDGTYDLSFTGTADYETGVVEHYNIVDL